MEDRHVAARALAALLACALAGAFGLACGGAALLRGPVADRCASADLRGCDDIADGVVLVVGGDKEAGLKKVERGAGENSPDRVRAFADTLGDVASTPGLGSYASPLREVADALRHSQGAEATAGATAEEMQRAQLAAASDATPVASTVGRRGASAKEPGDANLRVGTVSPGATGTDCETALGASRCERVLLGPADLTDVIVGGGCTAPLVMFVGEPNAPRWQIVVPANGSIALTGAEIPIGEDEKLEAATTTSTGLSPMCGVTWVARRR